MTDPTHLMMTDRAYLGDGVYASFDGYQIWLRTERDQRDHTIALEPPVLAALQAYADQLRAALKEAPSDG